MSKAKDDGLTKTIHWLDRLYDASTWPRALMALSLAGVIHLTGLWIGFQGTALGLGMLFLAGAIDKAVNPRLPPPPPVKALPAGK